MEQVHIYDVFKVNTRQKSLRLGSIKGLDRAIDQMKRMAARLPGEYFVSDASTHEVLASLNSDSGNASGLH